MGRSRPGVGARSALMGAVFLMATSAIGPGFITQTATFTVELGAAFAFGWSPCIGATLGAAAFARALMEEATPTLARYVDSIAHQVGGDRLRLDRAVNDDHQAV